MAHLSLEIQDIWIEFITRVIDRLIEFPPTTRVLQNSILVRLCTGGWDYVLNFSVQALLKFSSGKFIVCTLMGSALCTNDNSSRRWLK